MLIHIRCVDHIFGHFFREIENCAAAGEQSLGVILDVSILAPRLIFHEKRESDRDSKAMRGALDVSFLYRI